MITASHESHDTSCLTFRLPVTLLRKNVCDSNALRTLRTDVQMLCCTHGHAIRKQQSIEAASILLNVSLCT
jgi:hypothetical protein